MSIDVPAAGAPILDTWGVAVADAINDLLLDGSFAPYAFPVGYTPDDAPTSTYAVLAASGGAALVPMLVPGPMKLRTVTIYNGDANLARSVEFALYRSDGSQLVRIDGTDGTMSFTAAGTADRSGNITTADTLILPGVAWLAIRNTHASSLFTLMRQPTPTHLVGSGRGAYKTIGALGSTIDVASGWTVSHGPVSALLRGADFAAPLMF